MSFDLYLYQRKEEDFDENSLQTFMKNDLQMTYEEAEKCWKYEHPFSKVNFKVFQDKEVEDLVHGNYPEFKFTGFSFEINVIRADFFGRACLQVLKQIHGAFPFFILSAKEASPSVFDEAELLSLWRQKNELSIKTLYQLSKDAQIQVPDFVDKKTSDYFWQYSEQRPSIEAKLEGRDVFIPSLLFVRRSSDLQIKTVAVWTDSIPIVFPKTDYMIIQKVVGEGPSDLEGGFIAFDKVMEKIKPYLKAFEGPVDELFLLEETEAENLRDVFYDLKFEAPIRNYAQQVEAVNVVNIK